MSGELAEDFFSDQGLEIPPIDTKLNEVITEISPWHWASQPTPTPMQDYLLESVEYLKGPVPDQYSISHAGHGVNSYALNFRYVGGDIAILAQSGWGGAYMDSEDANRDWDHLQLVIGSVLTRAFIEDNDEVRVRKYLLVYSNFRHGVEILVNDGKTWREQPGFTSLEDACQFLIDENQ